MLPCGCVMISDPMQVSEHRFDCEVYKKYLDFEIQLIRQNVRENFWNRLQRDLLS